METARLEQLGLRVERGTAGVLATLELGEDSAPVNPVTGQPLSRVTFRLQGQQLIPIAPPAVVGLLPILLDAVSAAEDLPLLVTSVFDDYLFLVERRTAQLNTLGLMPHLDPQTLELSAELKAGPFSFTLVADRQGIFRVGQARRGGEVLTGLASHRFELSEFWEREALASYLAALVEETHARPQASPGETPGLVRYEEISRAFGPQALVPPRSALEVLVQLRVNGEHYRFAAARVMGRTFRGLLAGATGKVWAERFELDDFPGIVRLVADLLKVAPEAVQLVGPDTPQE
ncbi:MAG: hypothetical protein JXB05_18385 [Myxococcaceae bacterium]|nr:hypothetical protein [Myxococcaceae bacterium]